MPVGWLREESVQARSPLQLRQARTGSRPAGTEGLRDGALRLGAGRLGGGGGGGGGVGGVGGAGGGTSSTVTLAPGRCTGCPLY